MLQCGDLTVPEGRSCLRQFYVQGLIFSSNCYNTALLPGQGLPTFAVCCVAMNSACPFATYTK